MDFKIGNRVVSSIYFTDSEIAWRMEDAILVLEYLNSRNNIVLGGDVLTEKKQYNYDSWYYNVKTDQSLRSNVECSIKKASEYISNYIEINGNNFYVVFVVSGGQGTGGQGGQGDGLREP